MEIAGEYATLGAARAADVDADAILLGSSPALEDAEGPSVDEPLTPREIEVLELLARGCRTKRSQGDSVSATKR
jgi:DNA-binding NarL/FixJ family response regulator